MNAFLKRTVPALLILASLFAPAASYAQARTLQDLLADAQTEQQAGNYAAAASLFRRATVLSPNTAELWSNRGVMDYLAHQQEDAATSLKHALRLNPNLFVTLLFLGKLSLDRGDAAASMANLNKARTLQPADPEVLLALGKANALLGHPQEASSSYTAAAAADPANAAAWLGLGSSVLEIVTRDGRTLTSIAPKSIWARSLYADELLAQGRPLEALDVYTAAIAAASAEQRAVLAQNLQVTQQRPEQFPLPAVSQDALLKVIAQLKSSSNGTTAACTGAPAGPLRAASCAYWAAEYEQSASAAQLALQQGPHDIEALYWSIKANERLAVGALSRVDDLAPNSVTMHVLVGDLYREQRQPDGAAVEYAKALALDPHNPAALLGLSAADFAAAKLDDAAATAQTALSLSPSDPQLNLLMAEILGARGRDADVRPYLDKCGGIAPEFRSRVHYLLGRAAAADGNLPEAIHQFQLALPGDGDGKTHYQLSRLYRKTGEIAKAQQAEAEAKALVDSRDAKASSVVREETATSPAVPNSAPSHP